MSTEENALKRKKIASRSIKLQMAGDLLFARCGDPELSKLFKRYEAIFETFANLDKGERVLKYKFLIALIITSYAKKTKDSEEKKKLFDMKNKLYLNIANDRESRRKCAFRYLSSKNFRVIKFCEECVKKNTEAELERHKWKFCDNCEIDRKFYNILMMSHFYPKGGFNLFLSNDQVQEVKGLKIQNKGKLENYKEEGRYEKFHYNVKNLDVFDMESVLKVYEKLLKL